MYQTVPPITNSIPKNDDNSNASFPEPGYARKNSQIIGMIRRVTAYLRIPLPSLITTTPRKD